MTIGLLHRRPLTRPLVKDATGAWRAATVRPNGRDLIDLTGNGRDLLMGGESSAYVRDNALVLPGLDGNDATVSSEASLLVADDIDLRADVVLDAWVPASFQALVSKLDTGTDDGYELNVNGSGNLVLAWGLSGATLSAESTVTPTVSDGERLQVRATLDVDNGSSQYEVTFYTRSSGTDLTDDTGWSQLGATVTGGAVTSIDTGGADLSISGRIESALGNVSGSIYAAVVIDGLDATSGTTVLDIDFSDAPNGGDGTTFTATTGQTVTVNGTSTTNDPERLIHGGTRYLWLDGEDDNHATLDPNTGAFSGEIVVTATLALDSWAFGFPQRILDGYVSANNDGFYVRLLADGRLDVDVGDGTTSETLTTTSALANVTDGVESTLVVTIDPSASEVTVVVDGVEEEVLSGSFTSVTELDALTSIGASRGGAQAIRGEVSQVTVADDGTTVLDVDFTDSAQFPDGSEATSGTASTGQTVSLNGRATLVTSDRLFLDGDFLSVPHDPAFDVGASDDLTVVAVYSRRNSSTGSRRIAAKRTSGDSTGWVLTGLDGSFFAIGDGTNNPFENAGLLDNAKPSVHAGIRDATADEVTAYGDGATSSTTDTTTATSANSQPLTIGSWSDGGGEAPIEFWGFAIFVGRALTAAEIAQVGRELAYGEVALAA